MSIGRRTRNPSFFWQGLLIVLPVLALAALGLVSLRQDQRLAEQEARQRAHELARQLSAGLSRRVAAQIGTPLAGQWDRCFRDGFSVWPRSKLPDEDDAVFKRQRESWSTEFPGLEPGAVLFVPVFISETGLWHSPRDWPATPSPPDWFNELPPDTIEAWQAAQALEVGDQATAPAKTAAWRKVLESASSPEGRTNACFALLRSRILTNAPIDAVQQLWRFVEHNEEVQTDAGLPLSAVALGVALRLSEKTGFTEELFQLFRRQVEVPSLLTSRFLEDAVRLAGSDPSPGREAVRALREYWEHQERLRQLLRLALASQPLPEIGATNLWITNGTERWLVTTARIRPVVSSSTPFRSSGTLSGPTTTGPSESDAGTRSHRMREGKGEGSDNNGRLISFFAESVLTRAFANGLQEEAAVIPAYFGLGLELVGETILLPQRAVHGSETHDPSRLLAVASGAVILPPGRVASLGDADFKVVVSSPPFRLSVYLDSPGLLYARQRQRTVWFGALILAVALAALIGFIRARRAFLREHQLGELKTNFVSSVSHELRAPIASVRLMAESLERGKVPDPAKQHEYFRFMVQECRRLSSLIGNVLDFSRIEQGRQQYEFEPTDIVVLVRETVQLMQVYGAERGVQLALQLPEPPSSHDSSSSHQESAPGLQPSLDGRAIQQALVNLIDNALKHSPNQATVTVGLSLNSADRAANRAVPEPTLRLWVQDCGPGIPASEHERIFERFYRLGSELRRETQGVGIGLSIVKHIVEAHQGSVTVQSETGQGSCFTLELPIQQQLEQGSPTSLNNGTTRPAPLP